MAPLSLVWTACVWTAVTLPVLSTLEIQYPAEGGRASISCSCKNRTCQAVFWFWMGSKTHGNPQFLLYYNNAERTNFANLEDSKRLKCSKSDGIRTTYTLSIISVNKIDTGRYFCLLQYPSGAEPAVPGTELRPGESPPTAPPPTKRPKKPPPCICKKPVLKYPPRDCNPHIQWSLVGILLGLAAVLISTLYYFSRLPKKCRHKFAKKHQLM